MWKVQDHNGNNDYSRWSDLIKKKSKLNEQKIFENCQVYKSCNSTVSKVYQSHFLSWSVTYQYINYTPKISSIHVFPSITIASQENHNYDRWMTRDTYKPQPIHDRNTVNTILFVKTSFMHNFMRLVIHEHFFLSNRL